MANTTLEATLQSIISDAVARAVGAVRADMAAKIGITLGGGGGAGAATPKRRGRPPGSGRAAKAQSSATPATRKPRVRRGSRTYSESDLARVVQAIKSKPGALPSEFQKASGLKDNVFKAAVFRLKQDGRIKVVGKARKTSYQLT